MDVLGECWLLPWRPGDLMMILPDADTYACVCQCTLAGLQTLFLVVLVFAGVYQGIFALWVTGNDLKCLSFWPRDLNMCMHDYGRFIYSEKKTKQPPIQDGDMFNHICFRVVAEGSQQGKSTLREHSLWPLFPPSLNMGGCTESKHCVTAWLNLMFRVNAGKLSSPLIENLLADLRRPRGVFSGSGCQPAYTSSGHKSSSRAYRFDS